MAVMHKKLSTNVHNLGEYGVKCGNPGGKTVVSCG